MPWIVEQGSEISWSRLEELMRQTVAEARKRICKSPKRVLLLPPDITRMHSGAGRLTEILYQLLSPEAEVHVIPTLGQHVPHTPEENQRMFGSIPEERIHAHDWRGGCVQVGEISAEEVAQSCGGVANWPIPITLNRSLMEDQWDLIINVGHVVPHEVLGFANHNKNYFIGVGGKDLICAAHLMAARCGIENNLGNLVTPVRHCFNLAEERFLGNLPDLYVQVVMARNANNDLVHTGVFIGDDLETYLQAAKQSREQNITVFDEPVKKIVCVMQGDEFVSTWVANKAVYRTRMAIADGGELLILAPGLKRFGEQPDVDQLIRKFGYVPTPQVMEHYHREPIMQDLAHATAHLMHGTSEDRFKITYAPGFLSKEEIESVNFAYADLDEMLKRYEPDTRKEGWNKTADGEEFYFIPTPSAGLWSTRQRLYDRPTGFTPS
ncbi:lactate racemase domain-containing protein [Planctomicrobium sp. SH664]|uniref:lactate racemase domain-containing protein n=1 Tax=Planctomicrobium sp. SH664 TaxID=3448125 RepID=UPI003F5C9B71